MGSKIGGSMVTFVGNVGVLPTRSEEDGSSRTFRTRLDRPAGYP
jgi:hypothetical protein